MVPRVRAYHYAAHVVIGAALGFEPDPLSCAPRERWPDLLGRPQDRDRRLALYLVAGVEAEHIAHLARSATGRTELQAAARLVADTEAVKRRSGPGSKTTSTRKR